MRLISSIEARDKNWICVPHMKEKFSNLPMKDLQKHHFPEY
jgi:hypothetical protein